MAREDGREREREMILFINYLFSVPYAVDRTALKAMLERHGEEIKKKLEEFAEIMKKEHVRILNQ